MEQVATSGFSPRLMVWGFSRIWTSLADSVRVWSYSNGPNRTRTRPNYTRTGWSGSFHARYEPKFSNLARTIARFWYLLRKLSMVDPPRSLKELVRDLYSLVHCTKCIWLKYVWGGCIFQMYKLCTWPHSNTVLSLKPIGFFLSLGYNDSYWEPDTVDWCCHSIVVFQSMVTEIMRIYQASSSSVTVVPYKGGHDVRARS